MKLLAALLRLLAAFMRLFPCKQRIVLMSRQSSKVSLDYRYLKAELDKRLGEGVVELCVNEPETKSLWAFFTGTLRQLKFASTSKVIVTDGYNPAICIPKRRQGTTVIQLWHALGAVKKFGYQSVGTKAGRSAASAEAACMHKNYDVIVSAGPGANQAYAEAFGYPVEAVTALGLPRIDYLLDPNPHSARRNRCAELAEQYPVLRNGKRNVVYAPTLRKGEGYEGWIDEYLTALAGNCPADQANLIFAGHPLDKDAGSDLTNQFPCLHILPDASTIDLLEVADCIITDYSAISLEAGLLKKNACFFVPDIDCYAQSPGLNVDLLGGQAGFASTDSSAVMDVALGCSADAGEAFARFHEFADAYFEGIDYGCTQRVTDLLIEKLSGKEA